MPFKSEKQRRYLWMEHPDIAEKWAHGKHSSTGNHRMPRDSARSKKRGSTRSTRGGRR